MVRPKNVQPTPAELEVLHVLWRQGESTVREVLEELNVIKPRAYTSVMSLLNVMDEKRLVKRRQQGRAFVYAATQSKDKTLGGMVRDLMGRAFDGSAASLVVHLLDQAHPDEIEIESIRKAIEAYEQSENQT